MLRRLLELAAGAVLAPNHGQKTAILDRRLLGRTRRGSVEQSHQPIYYAADHFTLREVNVLFHLVFLAVL